MMGSCTLEKGSQSMPLLGSSLKPLVVGCFARGYMLSERISTHSNIKKGIEFFAKALGRLESFPWLRFCNFTRSKCKIIGFTFS